MAGICSEGSDQKSGERLEGKSGCLEGEGERLDGDRELPRGGTCARLIYVLADGDCWSAGKLVRDACAVIKLCGE